MLIAFLGLLAAALIPQVKKALPRGATRDLSFKTLGILATGLGLWIAYGAAQGDWVIIIANVTGLSLVATLLALKRRDQAAA